MVRFSSYLYVVESSGSNPNQSAQLVDVFVQSAVVVHCGTTDASVSDSGPSVLNAMQLVSIPRLEKGLNLNVRLLPLVSIPIAELRSTLAVNKTI
jgi:hypothetical protein